MADDLVKTLDRDGVVRLTGLLSREQLASMQEAFAARLRRVRWNHFDGYEKTERYRHMVQDVLTLDQGFVDVALHPVVEAGPARVPGRRASAGRRRRAGGRCRPRNDFHGWHGDAWYDQTVVREIPREVKLGFYLTDVTSGAFHYVKGSHRKQHPRPVRDDEFGADLERPACERPGRRARASCSTRRASTARRCRSSSTGRRSSTTTTTRRPAAAGGPRLLPLPPAAAERGLSREPRRGEDSASSASATSRTTSTPSSTPSASRGSSAPSPRRSVCACAPTSSGAACARGWGAEAASCEDRVSRHTGPSASRIGISRQHPRALADGTPGDLDHSSVAGVSRYTLRCSGCDGPGAREVE